MNIREYDNDIRNIRNDTLRTSLEPFGFTVERPFTFDCGDRTYVKGPGVPYLFSGVSECGDDWTSSGHALIKLIKLGLVSDVVIESLMGDSNDA